MRFHNPNTEEETAEFLLKIFIEANMPKVEEMLKREATNEKKERKEGYVHKIS